MKPLTPRIRTFFKIDLYDGASGERQRLMRQRARHRILRYSLAICGQLQNLKAAAVDAVRVPSPVGCVQTGALSEIVQGLRVHARLKQLQPTPVYLGKGTRERRRNGPDKVVDGARPALPVNASVFRASPPKV